MGIWMYGGVSNTKNHPRVNYSDWNDGQDLRFFYPQMAEVFLKIYPLVN